ncbi:hypothetical protein PPYR_01637 [Photinus pyralis]|uniref:Lipase domain-containing protein n=1 Tax=Photinus pyralis TaxID=7054 RepID=A0A5N4B4Y2_PHOPY|nr:lipase member H-like [Photinus pyralis]KAB0804667.1 hypothetical protein PPYR_01637 [Photinus pyralis]
MNRILYLCVFVFVFSTGQLFEVPNEILEDLGNFVFGTLDVIISGCGPVNPRHVKYIYFNNKNVTEPILLNYSNINRVIPNLPTKIIIHGWYGLATGPTALELKDAYLKRGSYNIIFVNWEHYANVNYAEARCRLSELGDLIGDFLQRLYANGKAHLNQTHIIGHSLGAHLAGYIGQRIQYRNGGQKLSRITGLDAAGPGFLGFPSYSRLDAGDAFFVDAIHTNGAQFGYPRNYGSVDFYPNCGLFQPGCLDYNIADKATLFQQTVDNIGCSHDRSMKYFIESINSRKFIASDYDTCFLFHKCRRGAKKTSVVMGEDCPFSATGSYCLSTNSKFPYAKGK